MKRTVKHIFSCICMVLMTVMIVNGCAPIALGGDRIDVGIAEAVQPVDLMKDYENDPNISKQKKSVIRVGVFRGEDYWYWNEELKYMANELYARGIISKYQTRNYPDMDETWEALSGSSGMMVRGRLEFVPEYLFTYDQMSDEELDKMLDIDDLDLMLTFGTAAGKFLTANADRFDYDYMVFGATNTVASGIVKSESLRFNDHSFAMVDTTENERMIRAVYDICPFENIGVVYENNEDAYIYSGVDVLDRLSGELGFTVHKEYVDETRSELDEEKHYKELTEAYERLIPKIDVLFVTIGAIEDNSRITELTKNVIDAGIITIAQESEEQCEAGLLIHYMVANSHDDGMFMADTMEEYCKGTPITDLEMEFVAEPKLYLNYDVIKQTGVRLPMKAYIVADTIYQSEGAK